MILIRKLKQLYIELKNSNFYRKMDERPFFTELILIIMAFIYLFGLLTNTSQIIITNGAMIKPLIIYYGEWWRFITPIFIHLGFLHILMNGISLYYVGIQIEKIFGHIRFLTIFMLSGIMGNIISFAFSSGLSAGASTAIFGLFGVFLMLGENFRDNFAVRQMSQSFLLLIIVNIVFDLLSSGIDIAGHLGGLIGGFFIPYFIGIPNYKMNKSKKILSFVVLMIIIIFCLKTGYMSNN
ncbi:rhomboid family intramembrane serine protease [Apilactobacillus micheneri]|uniref:Rhomboid family intramembrane serine protease n=2 Tax=Apilactobacillus micheneri TaxID=1899430 RepID=A0A9Q8MUF6_9LACO|nr:rhomboid family intramembrane serine protease [Apilactobacillus micheneri]TPR42019.1 rhomboid family intramembrane serine protease [Apilactobacillus micheneri]TPR44674.1 rhomboid family intramembrane serine protease [Apilactobacillus micheneri]TPR44973.1 rhomboid family intramembrane serine protease [Apilactobacillus micheneri]TPR46315.1 rhomboid family intramembrane serine protease [Apilactobacillus micheneri]